MLMSINAENDEAAETSFEISQSKSTYQQWILCPRSHTLGLHRQKRAPTFIAEGRAAETSFEILQSKRTDQQ